MAEGVQGISSSTDRIGANFEDFQKRRPEEDGSSSVNTKKPEEDIHTKARTVAYVNPSGAPGVFGFGFPAGGIQKPKDTSASASMG